LFVLVIGYGFVLGPVVPILRQSFNRATFFPAAFSGFTLDWYRELGTRSDLLATAASSIRIGAGATVLALIVGVSAAFAIVRGPSWLRGSMMTAILMSPIVVPQIVVGLAILQLITLMGWRVSTSGLIVAHAVFVAPFVTRTVAALLEAQGHDCEQVAMTLGAPPRRVVATVTLPMLWPAIVAGSMFAFTLSFVNVPLSLFLAPSGDRPLPIAVYQLMTSSISPLIAALCVVIVACVVVVAFLVEKVLRVRLLQ
jgi:putative spermidine/putrescine transport system permease protein